MAVKKYKKNGKFLYRVYVHLKGKIDKTLRVQKSRFNISCLSEARTIEKKLIRSACEEMNKKEGQNVVWSDLIQRWEIASRSCKTDSRYNDPITRQDHVNRLQKHTSLWSDRNISNLNRGDGRELLNLAKSEGHSATVRKKLKSSVNVLFKWAIEERLSQGVYSSPLEGIQISGKTEKKPMILSFQEVQTLLSEAKTKGNRWYPIWVFAFLTGMRSGELKALKWKDIDFEKSIITVSKSYCPRRKIIKSTKAGYWRNIPISEMLFEVLSDLKDSARGYDEDFVLPRIRSWLNGDAGSVLRKFLKSIGIDKYVVFHTLRSCFATHMLARGANQATVMKIGGWRDIKTFQIYIRLAGIEVKGATDVLVFD